MSKQVCSKGHKYDNAIYGDNCPFCPSSTGTRVNPSDDSASTIYDSKREPVSNDWQNGGTISIEERESRNRGGATTISPISGNESVIPNGGRKLVGLLVTYSEAPLGECFKLFEGRNYIGRDRSCDICLTNDSQVSSKHLSILFRSIDNKFKFKDEQSSNGTFFNERLEDEGELTTFDVLRIGKTTLIFIAIPQIC